MLHSAGIEPPAIARRLDAQQTLRSFIPFAERGRPAIEGVEVVADQVRYLQQTGPGCPAAHVCSDPEPTSKHTAANVRLRPIP